jgi:hypothetical protein
MLGDQISGNRSWFQQRYVSAGKWVLLRDIARQSFWVSCNGTVIDKTGITGAFGFHLDLPLPLRRNGIGTRLRSALFEETNRGREKASIAVLISTPVAPAVDNHNRQK